VKPRPFSLFTRFGVELEYAIVDSRSLAVRPVADALLRLEAGRQVSDLARGRLEWSNELALHVIELKTGRPAVRLDGLADLFQAEVQHINDRLHRLDSRLLPTAMHPWMDPARESRLWPHDNHEIYATFDRIFGCRGHGWTNLQSVHLNVPFANDDEFVRLHTALRLVLPLLPALAASSPFVEGRRAPTLDTRLDVYRGNCSRVPSVTAGVIPEAVRSIADYRKRILGRIGRDILEFDPEAILDPEWTNARGVIARFCRNTLELRVLDVQECPLADLAILGFVVEILRTLVAGTRSSTQAQLRVPNAELEGLFCRTIRSGRRARVNHRPTLRALGVRAAGSLTAQSLLRTLLDETAPRAVWWRPVIELILQEGNLAERIVRAAGPQPTRRRLQSVYRRLADCLQQGTLFLG
jgi:glutamate---cysteine ligase / carboxylate-amine ligase